MTKVRLKRVLFLVLGVGFLLLVWANRTGRLEPKSYLGEGRLTRVTDATVWGPGTIPVTVGTWVENISSFEVASQKFEANGSVWFVWPQELQSLMEARGLGAQEAFTVANVLGDLTLTPLNETPLKRPDGRYYQAFQFSGTFVAYGLDFRRFPFQSAQLPLAFSVNAERVPVAARLVRLRPDEKESGFGEYVHIPGFVTNGSKFSEWQYDYGTRFGLPTDVAGQNLQSSRLQFALQYQTSPIASYLKLLLPLMVVMMVVLLSPSLAASLWDVRIALPSTALLTLVFLQQAYSEQLPVLPYLTFLDQVYALCYATALAFFALFVWSSNQLDNAGDNRAEVVQRINRVDHRFQVVAAIALVTLTVLSWFVPVR